MATRRTAAQIAADRTRSDLLYEQVSAFATRLDALEREQERLADVLWRLELPAISEAEPVGSEPRTPPPSTALTGGTLLRREYWNRGKRRIELWRDDEPGTLRLELYAIDVLEHAVRAPKSMLHASAERLERFVTG